MKEFRKRKKSFVHFPSSSFNGAAVLVVAFCSLLLFACEEKIKPSIASTGLNGNVPTQESWKAKITITDSGKVSGILHAGHIAVYEDKKYTYLDSGIVVDFFDENEHHTSVLTAKQGKVNDLTHDLEAHGNVVVVSDSGTVLRTEDLYWNNTTQRVYSQDYVEITSPKEAIKGHGFESDRSLKQYRIFKVTGQAKPNE